MSAEEFDKEGCKCINDYKCLLFSLNEDSDYIKLVIVQPDMCVVANFFHLSSLIYSNTWYVQWEVIEYENLDLINAFWSRSVFNL